MTDNAFAAFRAECEANVAAYKAKLDADFAARKAQLDAQNQVMRASRDAERERYQLGIEVQRAKGLITPSEYNTIRACLHPDNSASTEKRAEAFRLFNDAKIKLLLVKEPPKERPTWNLPPRVADLKRKRPRKPSP